MKRSILTGVVCVGLALTVSTAAWAEKWVTPVNGTVSAMMMPDGDVMMKVQMPVKEFAVIDRDMKAQQGGGKIQEIYPGATDTMILVCGPNL